MSDRDPQAEPLGAEATDVDQAVTPIDTPVDDMHIERHMMCTFCNAYNAVRMSRPS